MTVAAEEARGMTMGQNGKVDGGHVHDAEDVCDLQQCNGNQNFKCFENGLPGSVFQASMEMVDSVIFLVH